MKNSRALFLNAILIVLILSSCFLQKRQYIQGHSLSWQNPKHKTRTFERVNSVKNCLIKKEIVCIDNNELSSVSNSNSVDVAVKKPKLIITESLVHAGPVETTIDNSFKDNTQRPAEEKRKSDMGIIPSILMMFLGI